VPEVLEPERSTDEGVPLDALRAFGCGVGSSRAPTFSRRNQRQCLPRSGRSSRRGARIRDSELTFANYFADIFVFTQAADRLQRQRATFATTARLRKAQTAEVSLALALRGWKGLIV